MQASIWDLIRYHYFVKFVHKTLLTISADVKAYVKTIANKRTGGCIS